MPIKSHKLGPGTLKLGSVPLEVNAQLRQCRVTPSENVTTTDTIKVLSGEKLEGEDTVDLTFVLEGAFLQDLDAAGVVAWSWTNKSTWQDFVFVPNNVAASEVTGEVRVIPISVGGDEVDVTMQSDFSWTARTVDFDVTPDGLPG
jgi:hypothetical protein